MCFDVDLVLCDVNGFQELLGELARIYEDPDCALPPLIWGGVPSVRDFNVVEVDSLVPSFAFGKNAAGLSGCLSNDLKDGVSQDFKIVSKYVIKLRKTIKNKKTH